MPKYFMHLVDGSDILLDQDGMDMTPEAVAGVALTQARDCMAGDVRDGYLQLNYRIEVHDESGTVVHRLAFGDAVDIRPAS